MFALAPHLRKRNAELQTNYWARRNSAFGRAVVARGFGSAEAVYAFNGAALEIFSAAKARGLRCILDQTAAPWRYNTALLREEMRRWPGWETRPAEIDASFALSAREEAEWSMADLIICGSQFAADAVAASNGPKEKCIVVSYAGHVPFNLEQDRQRPPLAGRKLRVLTVGSLQLRKGAPYLMQAARTLSDRVEFRWVGDNLLSAAATEQLSQSIDLTGPAPRAEISRHYAWADVLVLPTLSEGAANVVLEAAAAGLPIITTPASGAPGEAGARITYVPARDAEALAAAIANFVEPPVGAIEPAGHASFAVYSQRLADGILRTLSHAAP